MSYLFFQVYTSNTGQLVTYSNTGPSNQRQNSIQSGQNSSLETNSSSSAAASPSSSSSTATLPAVIYPPTNSYFPHQNQHHFHPTLRSTQLIFSAPTHGSSASPTSSSSSSNSSSNSQLISNLSQQQQQQLQQSNHSSHMSANGQLAGQSVFLSNQL